MTKFIYKFKINDYVMVKDALAKGTETKCKVIDRGIDDHDVIWYTCVPVEFNCSVSREFTEDRLTFISK